MRARFRHVQRDWRITFLFWRFFTLSFSFAGFVDAWYRLANDLVEGNWLGDGGREVCKVHLYRCTATGRLLLLLK
jgi:hypothetical protein